MNFCENCNILLDSDYCYLCDNKKLRQVKDDDFCFLTECEYTFGNVFNEDLQKEGIESAFIPYGDGVRTVFGLKLDKFRVYVKYKDYDRALELYKFFSNYKDTGELKDLLLTNFDKWKVVDDYTEKKIRKKLKISKTEDINDFIKVCVLNSDLIEDKGYITINEKAQRAYYVKTGEIYIWFSAEDYKCLI